MIERGNQWHEAGVAPYAIAMLPFSGSRLDDHHCRFATAWIESVVAHESTDPSQ